MAQPIAFVIEDDLTLSNVFAKAVATADFDVQIFNDGQTAMAQLAQAQPTLIVLDLHLPYISGREILYNIRTMAHLSHTDVIIVSADTQLAEYLRDQATLVLMKPVSFHQLRQLALRLSAKANHRSEIDKGDFSERG